MSETDLVFTAGEVRMIAQKLRRVAHLLGPPELPGDYQTRCHELARKLDTLADEYEATRGLAHRGPP